jgi:hypothetical protein
MTGRDLSHRTIRVLKPLADGCGLHTRPVG